MALEDKFVNPHIGWFNYVLKNLKELELINVNNFSPEEHRAYEDSLKYYRDLNNVVNTAKEDRALEIAKNLKENGVDIETIAISTGLSRLVIEGL